MKENEKEDLMKEISKNDWDILYKFNKVLEINANKYGKDNAILTFIEYFNNGRTEVFTREDNSRTIIEELDKDKLYELLKSVFAVDGTMELLESAFEFVMEEKMNALNNAAIITYDKYEREKGIGKAQVIGALKKLWLDDNYNLFSNEHNLREELKRTVSSNDLILLMGYILNDHELLEKGNSLRSTIDIEKVIAQYVSKIEKKINELRVN